MKSNLLNELTLHTDGNHTDETHTDVYKLSYMGTKQVGLENKKRDRVRKLLRCPNCNSKDVGKIGSHQFYCWGCFIELSVNGEKVMSVYQVEEDGTLSSLDDLFIEEDIPQESTQIV